MDPRTGDHPDGERSNPRDRSAIAALMARYAPRLERYAARHMAPPLRCRESPADIVQSACREILQDLSAFDDHGAGEVAFKNWLYATTLRKLRDRQRYYRRQRRDVAREIRRPDDPQWDPCRTSGTPSRDAIGAEDCEQLRSALTRLPDHYRDVIRLSYFEGLSSAEVARRLGKSRDAVHSLLARALARLARVFRIQEATAAARNPPQNEEPVDDAAGR